MSIHEMFEDKKIRKYYHPVTGRVYHIFADSDISGKRMLEAELCHPVLTPEEYIEHGLYTTKEYEDLCAGSKTSNENALTDIKSIKTMMLKKFHFDLVHKFMPTNRSEQKNEFKLEEVISLIDSTLNECIDSITHEELEGELKILRAQM